MQNANIEQGTPNIEHRSDMHQLPELALKERDITAQAAAKQGLGQHVNDTKAL
jgi:hypothetical protein